MDCLLIDTPSSSVVNCATAKRSEAYTVDPKS